MGRTKGKDVITETTFGDEVLHGLNDFLQSAAAGRPITIREVTLELKPGDYDADAVKMTRHKLGVSQALFARLLVVNVKTVQAWEHGDVTPSGPARRLLDDVNQDPRRWMAKLIRAQESKSTKSRPSKIGSGA
jgi:putative transcriptional regulator